MVRSTCHVAPSRCQLSPASLRCPRPSHRLVSRVACSPVDARLSVTVTKRHATTQASLFRHEPGLVEVGRLAPLDRSESRFGGRRAGGGEPLAERSLSLGFASSYPVP